ncbi:MAG: HEAT repeat domain-containing protein [Myxococcales bacterium]|nr:MAG: HEAT repeat domain-containing protein [Myxococcales bacterium]
MRAWLCLLLLLSACFVVWPSVTQAQSARANFLIKRLKTSDHFRVRVQAALSLGDIPASTQVHQALVSSLDDDHPAVRMAAVAALEMQKDTDALSAISKRLRDRDPKVRSAAARAISVIEKVQEARSAQKYYVGVGLPGSNVTGLARKVLAEIREFLRARVAGMPGVRMVPDDESKKEAARVLADGSLTGFYVDSSVVKLEETADGLRAEVSVIISTYPGHDIRAMLNGAARVSGGDPTLMRRRAIEGAFSGALRRLPQAMKTAGGGR